MEDLCDSHIDLFSSSLRPSVFRVVFFSIFQFIDDTTLLRVTILNQTYKVRKQFSRWQRVQPEATF